ncbi:hypothetical protein [Burkholderia cenocepacia]|uniref:hypothetical protein n=1 Tax=Burkholderia cenocepacia TaxID=95486 RepID=UPI001B990D88|nr:hypothetical protein [Burkholderia cenocepacia]MBR8137204.1 hypothetical protein [Burkholderia cenocepacia]
MGRTIEEEFRDSDDDWLGFASGQERRDGNSLRDYLQRYAKVIPIEHVIVSIEIVLRASYPTGSVPAPCLHITHFDPGHSVDPARLFRTSLETGEHVELKSTSLPFDDELFQVFSDFRIELTARGYFVEPIDEGGVYGRPEDVDD